VTEEEPATRELTLKETYYISSMPEPVLALIYDLVQDGASLTSEKHENSPVAAAAAGLFSLPTLALAMYRAISPYYYASDKGGGGNMYESTVSTSPNTDPETDLSQVFIQRRQLHSRKASRFFISLETTQRYQLQGPEHVTSRQ
jgi:hypothetical protein